MGELGYSEFKSPIKKVEMFIRVGNTSSERGVVLELTYCNVLNVMWLKHFDLFWIVMTDLQIHGLC